MLDSWYDFSESSRSELIESLLENEIRDGREIKRAIRISQVTKGTSVHAVVSSKTKLEPVENRLLGIPVSGDPLTRHCYDTVRDMFIVEGVDWIEVGSIPVNYVLHLGDWSVNIPMPISVINRYLTNNQKTSLNNWKSKWDKKDYHIDYLQSLLVY